jgi:co-chaperonin GroES (HSP10)
MPVAEQDNIFRVGPTGFEAMFNQIIVLEDEFRSGYECKTCDATGKISCAECDGGKSRLNPVMVCKSCHGEQEITCPDCQGKRESIVVPETAQARPTSGVIQSVGEQCTTVRIGQRVLYPSFRGEVLQVDKRIVLRILKETEVICRMTGDYLELSRGVKRQTELGE